jgi:hypothetical protein
MKLGKRVRGSGMSAKYSAGNKVWIKPRELFGTVMDPGIRRYANKSGEIIESTNIVAFTASSSVVFQNSGGHITVTYYTVKISDGETLHDIPEDYLEMGD